MSTGLWLCVRKVGLHLDILACACGTKTRYRLAEQKRIRSVSLNVAVLADFHQPTFGPFATPAIRPRPTPTGDCPPRASHFPGGQRMKSYRRFIPPLVAMRPVAAASVCAAPIVEHLGSQAGWRLRGQLDDWENEGGSMTATEAAAVLIVTSEDGGNAPVPASADPQAGALDASRWDTHGTARDLFPRNSRSDDVAPGA